MAARARRFAVGLVALGAAGCSFIQPSSRGAPIADTVGAVVMAGSTAIAVAEMDTSPRTGAPDFTADTGYTAGVCTLTGLAVLYTLSAVYGFTRDKESQQWGPILGLQILALGLAGFSRGVNGSNDQRGCCSYHQGIGSGCGSNNRIMCADGEESPTCKCE